ncbi:hypothetical protein D9M68_328470 [compost metagenome]
MPAGCTPPIAPLLSRTSGGWPGCAAEGSALWAMSMRNWWPVLTEPARLMPRPPLAAGLPSTSTSSAVPTTPSAPGNTTCGKPFGPLMKLP